MHRLTVRIVEVYIFYSLSLWACFCFSFSNLVKLFLCPLGSCSKTKYSRVVSLTFLKFVRNLNASVLDSIVSSEHLYINKLRHVHLFTDWEDILFTDGSFRNILNSCKSMNGDVVTQVEKPSKTVTSTVYKIY